MTDYIEREAAIVLINRMAEGCTYLDITAEEVIDGISAIPAADVRENKRGKWVWNDQCKLVCSLCGNVVAFVSLPKKKWEAGYFCPNCGADMREENDGT